MTDERDPEVAQAYRELGREEPPRALDEAILAAARRPVRSAARRWAMPVSLAAVLVLSVSVTLLIHQEAPEVYAPAPVAKALAPAPAAEAPKPEAPKPEETVVVERPKLMKEQVAQSAPAAKAEARAQSRQDAFTPDPAPAAAAPVAAAPAPAAPAAAGAASSSVPQPAMQRPEQGMRDRAERQVLAESVAKRTQDAGETPEKWLERIAELRRAGRHDEADKALAEFRKRHPDYRIPEATLERLERREK
jgi:hypothetical protein